MPAESRETARIEWWGVVDFASWSQDDRPRKLAETRRRAATAGLFCEGAGSGPLVLRWSATTDLGDAFVRLVKATGVEPGDFRMGQPPQLI